MRAKEFITEARKAKFADHHTDASVGMNIFTDTAYDRIYMLNRVMMAAASTDGKTVPNMYDEGPIGKWNAALPYTQIDQDKLNVAYKAAGVRKVIDLNKGDLQSKESKTTNVSSPIKPFKGYKK